MKLFNPIQRDFVAPIDLNTLSNTYNTLQQGHREAVKAASDLEVTMANLDLNEAENGWKQQQINKIRSTIQNNTIDGNSAAAINSLITTAGNIMSDPSMIGKLNAQKDYKDYLNTLEKRNDIPEEYKNYYKEVNPYYYKDQLDESGKIIGGSKWKPIENAVSTVPLSDLIVKGISIAAKESGGGTVTRWLDENGQITTDPNKAYDGEVYDQTSSKWTKLSRDKIINGINAMIESTPGAKASLDQDYKIAVWNHNKLLKNSPDNLVVTDATDKNGILLTPNQYLSKRIAPGVEAAAYTDTINSTSWGRGLASYKAGQLQIASANKAHNDAMTEAAMSGRNSPVEVSVDAASNYAATRNNSLNMIKNIYKKATGKDLVINENTPIGDMPTRINGLNISPENKTALYNLTKIYNESIANMNAYTEKMSPEDKASFDFATRMKTGGELVKDKSKEDNEALSLINNIYKTGNKLEITLTDDSMKQLFLNTINGANYTNYKNLGIDIQGNKIIIPKEKMFALPIVYSALEHAKDQMNKGFIGTISGAFNNRFDTKIFDENNNDITNYGTQNLDNPFTGLLSNPSIPTKLGVFLGKLYDKSFTIGETLSNKYNVAPQKIIVSSLNLSGKSFEHGGLKEQFDKGLISKDQYNISKAFLDTDFANKISGVAFTQLDMYVNNENSELRTKVTKDKDRFKYGSEILEAIKDKRATYNPTVVTGITDPLSGAPIAGYNITITPKIKSDGTVIGDSYTKTFFIPNMIHENTSKQLMQDPYVQAFNSVQITGATKSTRILTDNNTTPYLGTISYTGLDDNNFNVNYDGMQFHTNTDGAVMLHKSLNNYNAIKNLYISGALNNMPEAEAKEREKRIRSTLVDCAKGISGVTGLDPSAILTKLLTDLNTK